MTTITREFAQDIIDGHGYGVAPSAVEALARIALASLEAGNSPVIPDGYVMVPKDMTCEMDDAAWDAYHETRSMSDIWAALLAAAPQEAKP